MICWMNIDGCQDHQAVLYMVCCMGPYDCEMWFDSTNCNASCNASLYTSALYKQSAASHE